MLALDTARPITEQEHHMANNRLLLMTSEALEKELDQIYAAVGRLKTQTHSDEITELLLHADKVERELDRRNPDR